MKCGVTKHKNFTEEVKTLQNSDIDTMIRKYLGLVCKAERKLVRRLLLKTSTGQNIKTNWCHQKRGTG